VPLGASASITEKILTIKGFVATPNGKSRIAGSVEGKVSDADALGRTLAEALLAQGADAILASLKPT
jgi:hydroxymethylbilane synthase